MTISPGTRLGHYEIISPIGAGGMGEVYLAEDTRLDRRVALKLLPAALVADEQAKMRLLREAKSAATLDHPNICAIYEVGEENGRNFIAMQFIDGETIAARIEHKPLDIRLALDLANQVADALAAAHSQGIVHRDIKPQNIMLTPRGQVKMLDFGLAKIVQQRSLLKSEAETQSPLTERGMIVGTVPYMSPEQVNGEPVDARSDIFSFGALLYEMVTGQQAFQGRSVMATLAAVLNQQPKPLPSEVPDGVARAILRCLEKDPAQRYQTMSDLKVALENLRERPSAAPAVQRPLRWLWIGAASLFVLLAIGLFVWQPWRAQQNMEPLRAIALTSLPGVELYPAFSPDGNNVAFTWTGLKQDNSDIYVQTIGSSAPSRLTTDPRQDLNPVWSPDGLWIAFLRGEPTGPLSYGKREVLVVAPFGGGERKVAEVRVQEFFPNPVYLAWSADSNALIVTDSPGEGKPDALFVIFRETGEKRPLTNPEPPVLADTNPAVSPDGHSLVFRRRVTWSHGELYVMPLGPAFTAAGEPRRLTPLVLAADYPTWMPDGKEILFSAKGFLWRMDISGASAPVRLPFVGEDGAMPVVSRPPPGKPARLAYVRSFRDTNIYSIKTSAPGAPALSSPVVAIASTGEDIHNRFSPDGRRVVFTSTRSGEWEIWVTDPDGSNAIQLTFMHAQATGGGHWSPDGQRIVFASDLEGQFEIYEIAASGGPPRRVTTHPALDHAPHYSADGKWIYFCSSRNGPYQLWKVPASGGDPSQVTTAEGFASFESVDGAYLYYTESSATSSPMWRVPTSGGPPVKLFDGVVMWDFAVLEKGIYYVDQAGAEQRLQFFDFDTRVSKTVARNLGENGGGVTATPDGRTILFNRKDSSIENLMLVENFR